MNLYCRSIVTFFALVLVVSCTKIKSTDIGGELIPAVDNINTFDTTLEVITENYLFPDSAAPRLLRNSTGSVPTLLAGQVNSDPQFGKTTGSLFFYLQPSGYPFSYEVKDSLYLDSVVLSLSWSGLVVGDTNRLQKFNVHLLETTPKIDSAYSINDAIPYDVVIGSKTFAPSILNDSLYLFRQTVTKQLRIKLDDRFGRQLLALDSSAGKPFNNDSIFRTFFPGVAVIPDASNTSANALMGFNISDTNTYVRIYYRYDSIARKDTTSKTFRYAMTSGFANQVRRNYSSAEIQRAVTPGVDSVLYIQATPGSYAKVRVPSLNGFKATKGNVLVHAAQLVMKQVPTIGQNDDLFPGPEYLYLDYQDTTTNTFKPFLTDAFPDGSYQPGAFGGVRKLISGPVGMVNTEYRFNLTRYIQGVITRNEPNFPLNLHAPYVISYTSPLIYMGLNPMANGRVKLGGGQNRSGNKMYLRIIYSRI